MNDEPADLTASVHRSSFSLQPSAFLVRPAGTHALIFRRRRARRPTAPTASTPSPAGSGTFTWRSTSLPLPGAVLGETLSAVYVNVYVVWPMVAVNVPLPALTSGAPLSVANVPVTASDP